MLRRLLASCFILVLAYVTTTGQVISICDFENGFCDWRNVGSHNASWKYNSGETPSQDTGPPSGHGGTGYYLFMEAGDFTLSGTDTVAGGHVTLISPNYTSTGSACFRLFYFIWANRTGGVGNLTVGILSASNSSIFSVEGSKNKSWTCGYSSVPKSSFQIYVEASVGSHNSLGDIAVDDFALFNTSCDAISNQSICETNAGKITTRSPGGDAVTFSSVPPSSSATETPQVSFSASSTASSNTTSAPLSDSITTVVSQSGDGSPLLFLIIPAAVVVLAIPVAIYCYCKRQREGAFFRFEPPYEPPSQSEPEVYDTIGPIDPNFQDNYAYSDIVDIPEETAEDGPPPIPCSRSGADLVGREPDVPKEHAPPPPAVDIYITAVNDDSQFRRPSLPRPASYLEMQDLPKAQQRAAGLNIREPGTPESQRSYLDMKNQTSLRSRPRNEETVETSDDDYENEKTEGTGDYLTPARPEHGDPLDSGAYLEPVAFYQARPHHARPSLAPADHRHSDALDAGAYLEPVAGDQARPQNAHVGLASSDQEHSDAESYCDPQLGPEVKE